MVRKLVTRSLVLLLVVVGVSGRAQVGSSWVVRPEWVKAHEDFLASDVLAGRGSATRDEQLAATYVASEFESYGLQFAPGMGGYLQSAAIDAPTLDGHAALAIGKLTLTETTDFDLLMSSGKGCDGAFGADTRRKCARSPRPAWRSGTAYWGYGTHAP